MKQIISRRAWLKAALFQVRRCLLRGLSTETTENPRDAVSNSSRRLLDDEANKSGSIIKLFNAVAINWVGSNKPFNINEARIERWKIIMSFIILFGKTIFRARVLRLTLFGLHGKPSLFRNLTAYCSQPYLQYTPSRVSDQ